MEIKESIEIDPEIFIQEIEESYKSIINITNIPEEESSLTLELKEIDKIMDQLFELYGEIKNKSYFQKYCIRIITIFLQLYFHLSKRIEKLDYKRKFEDQLNIPNCFEELLEKRGLFFLLIKKLLDKHFDLIGKLDIVNKTVIVDKIIHVRKEQDSMTPYILTDMPFGWEEKLHFPGITIENTNHINALKRYHSLMDEDKDEREQQSKPEEKNRLIKSKLAFWRFLFAMATICTISTSLAAISSFKTNQKLKKNSTHMLKVNQHNVKAYSDLSDKLDKSLEENKKLIELKKFHRERIKALSHDFKIYSKRLDKCRQKEKR